MKFNRMLVLLFIFTMISSIGCNSKNLTDTMNKETEQAITVEVAKAIKGQIESSIGYSGRVKPVQEIMITPKQPGKVTKINFDLGEKVKAGQVLFELDKKDAILQLNQAAAAVELAEMNLNKMAGSTYEQQLIQLKSALLSAEINYNDVKSNYEAIKTLYEAGAESKLNYDRLQSQLRITEQQYEAAKANYSLFEEKSHIENIELSKAQLDQTKAAYDIVQNSLNNMSVISPLSGTISAKNIKAGEFISNATVAFVIIDDSSYTIDINVSEDTIGKVHAGDTAKVSINSISEEMLSGTITATAPSADVQKQTYLVKISLNNPPDTVKGGMFAEVKLVTARVENCLTAPLSSIIEEEGKKYVFVVKDDKAAKIEIAAGIHNDKEIQIIDGITADDLIVVKGQDFLKDGSKITISNK